MIDGKSINAKDRCVNWIRHWFEENGKDCVAVIGISGGKDSTVAAGLLVEALGKERVLGVLMPNGAQADIRDSYRVCEYLEIKYIEVNIGSTVSHLQTAILSKGVELSDQTIINLPPRIRMATLYAISQSVNGRVVNTCNFSEELVGYSTRWGDNVGDFSPLGSLLTDEVMAIGDALGLPYDLVHKVPSDGLCGKTDEDNFGFTYEVLDKYIRTGTCEDGNMKEKIDRRHESNKFKLEPIQKGIYW